MKAIDRCITINPNAADMVGAMGFVLTCAGEFERGFRLLNDSILHNPYFPWWFNVGFSFYFLHKKEYPEALHWADRIYASESFWDPLLKATALGHLNRLEEAGGNLQLLKQLIPGDYNQVKHILESFLLSEDLNNEILEGLQKAGLNDVQQAPLVQLEGK